MVISQSICVINNAKYRFTKYNYWSKHSQFAVFLVSTATYGQIGKYKQLFKSVVKLLVSN